MMPNIRISLIAAVVSIGFQVNGQQIVSLDSILSVVKERNPMLKSYSSRADAMNAYAKGAKSWMAPEVGGGLWMLPYKKVEDPRDKGQIMLSIQQKFTNPAKLRANQGYLESKAAIEQDNRNVCFQRTTGAGKDSLLSMAGVREKENGSER